MSELKQKWAAGASTLGIWMTSSSPDNAEIVADADVDYITLDMQHGLVDYNGVLTMMRALARTSATVTVRVPWNEPGIIGKVLDAGAMGVIIPMVNTAEQARRAVAACRYAPEGSRSYGPIRAKTVNGPGYYSAANERVACIPMIETVEAISNLDEILAVPGIDAVYVGPADLSLTLGLAPQGDHPDESFQTALATIVAGCEAHGIVAGVHANPGLTATRLEQGFRMVTAVVDLLALGSGIDAGLAAARRTPGHAAPDDIY
ncbi:MAG: HpcH/HpaI aldolase/citrate lyase family protein [Ilumatobacter sp.]